MSDYSNEPGSIRPDPLRMPNNTTTLQVRDGMSGTTMAIIAVVVLLIVGAVVWSYSGTTVQTTTDPVADTPLPAVTPSQPAPAVNDTVAPLDAAPVEGTAPLDAAPLDVAPEMDAPADGGLAPADATTQP